VDTNGLKKTLRWSWILVLIAAIYSGAKIYMRARENRALEQAAVRQEAAEDRKVVDQLGGGAMKVLVFYANPPAIARGAKTLLCYGVASAQTVRIEPHVRDIKPALSECIEAHPTATTQYTFTATDNHGKVESRTATVTVH
jgi:hypothetical protein